MLQLVVKLHRIFLLSSAWIFQDLCAFPNPFKASINSRETTLKLSKHKWNSLVMDQISLWTNVIVKLRMFQESSVSKLPSIHRLMIWLTELVSARSESSRSTTRFRSLAMEHNLHKQSLVTTWITLSGYRIMEKPKQLNVSLSQSVPPKKLSVQNLMLSKRLGPLL